MITMPRNSRGSRRGSVLLCVLIFALAASSVALYAVNDAMNARQVNVREETYADGLSAAEYGAELAVSGIAKGLVDASGKVIENPAAEFAGDWVLGQDYGRSTLFESDGTIDPEQRRIRGVFNDHEFRVRVRSTRLAYAQDLVATGSETDKPLPEGWLWNPDAQYNEKQAAIIGNFGDAGLFRDVYEITATARPRGVSAGIIDPARSSEPTVQAIIEYEPFPAYNALANLPTLFMERPENFKPDAVPTKVLDPSGIDYSGTTFIASETAYAAPVNTITGPVQRLKTVDSISISGEDHNIRKQSVPRIVSDTITTPLRMTTTDARFFNALGSYWSSGYLTLNFIDINNNNPYDARKFKDVEVLVTPDNKPGTATVTRTVKMPVANTLRPYNYTVDTNYLTAAQLEDLRNTVNRPINAGLAMRASFNDGRTLDTYLLGGKGSRTIEYAPLNLLNGHTVNGAATVPAVGVITSQTTANNSFSIVLGAFEDLPRLYINMSNGPTGCDLFRPETWSEMYVGQYTRNNRGTTLADSSAPILRHGSTTAKIRPQTVQTLLNINDEMLVREYSVDVFAGRDEDGAEVFKTISFAYPATGAYTYFENSVTGEIAFTDKNPGGNGNNGNGNGNNKDNPWGEIKKVNWTANAWTGNYTWAKANLNNGSYALAANVYAEVAGFNGTKLSFQTQKSGTVCTPRQFFWQELVGYSLVKDWSNERYGEPMLINDGLGYAGGGDNPPSSRRTIPFEDENGQRIIVGFDEAYQRSPKYRDIPERWEPEQPNAALKALDYPTYLVDAHDPVPVRNIETGELENKYTMDDFLFLKKFITNKDENGDGLINDDDIIERDALCLYIGYEDQVEWTADYNYTDMIFSIYIAPTVEVIEKDVVTIDPTSKQWWEREEIEGLSGKASHAALGVNLQSDIALQEGGTPKTDAELRAEHYARFGINPDSDAGILANGVWTMHAAGTDDIIDFPRASFIYEPYGLYGEKMRNTGRLDEDDPVVARFLKLAEEGKTVGGKAVFYYTRGDLVDYMQYFVSGSAPGHDLDQEVAKWSDGADDWRYLLAEDELETVVNTGLGVPVDFRPIDDRWLDRDEDNALRTEHALLEPDQFASMIVSREPVSVRKLAADLVGSSVESVPMINTRDFTALSGAVAQATSLGFIAGEIMNTAGNDAMRNGIISDASGDNGGIPLRSDILTFPEIIDDAGTHRTGHAQGFFGAMPSDPADKSALDEAAKKVVAMCYADFFNGQVDPTDTSLQRDVYAKQDVQDAYGIKEERHSIGFHRTGKEYDLRKDNAQDRMEIAVLGLRGFNPYRSTPFTPSYIANEQYGPEEDQSYAVHANYEADGGVAPTFVFDKPIDGAGALIVNGNLHIKSTFAYYGVLIVLGDIIIEPGLHESQFVYNSNGHAVDAWGNTIRRRDPNSNEWQYEDQTKPHLDDDGNVLDHPVPALQDVYRGELIVQGLVAAKGRVIMNREAGRTGVLNVFWNSEAVRDVANAALSVHNPLVRRISWTHDDSIDVENLWQDKTDSGLPVSAVTPVN